MIRRYLAALGACVAACGPRDTPLAAPRIDTLPGGVVRVVNSGPSAWADTSGWKLVLERTVHGTETVPLSDPRGLVTTGRGELAVLDGKPARILLFDADGAFRRVIGRQGAGPGEFAEDARLVLVGDTLLVNDWRQSRLVYFTLDGAHLRTTRLETHSSTVWPATPDGRFFVETYVERVIGESTPDDWFPGLGVVRIRGDGTPIDSIRFPKVPKARIWEIRTATSSRGTYIPFSPRHERMMDRDGRLIHGDQARYRLAIATRTDDTLRIIEGPTAPVTIPDAIRRETFDAEVTRLPWLKTIASLGDVPTEYPAWSVVAADGANRLWVLRPGARGAADGWDVFTAEGTLLGRVPAPFPDAEGTYWTADRVYRIGEGGDGLPVIEIWRIARND